MSCRFPQRETFASYNERRRRESFSINDLNPKDKLEDVGNTIKNEVVGVANKVKNEILDLEKKAIKEILDTVNKAKAEFTNIGGFFKNVIWKSIKGWFLKIFAMFGKWASVVMGAAYSSSSVCTLCLCWFCGCIPIAMSVFGFIWRLLGSLTK